MERTLKLLEELKKYPEINDFLFVGGTALAIQIKHRQSYDLDFMYAPAQKDRKFLLNQSKIKKIIDRLESQGHHAYLIPVSDEVYLEFINEDIEGEGINGAQQDWDIDGVKLSFFIAPNLKHYQGAKDCKCIAMDYIRMADINTLFKFKTAMLVERNKIRDYYDIYKMIEDGYIAESSFAKELTDNRYNTIVLNKVEELVVFKDDEGLRTLSDNNIEIGFLKNYFLEILSRIIQKEMINKIIDKPSQTLNKTMKDNQ